MKRIDESGVVRLWIETGSAIVNKIPSEANKNVGLRWNRAMFSFKWLFDFPMVPELPSVY